jgi:hypothetical protein
MLPTPDPDAAPWLAKMIGYAAAAGGAVWGFFKLVNKKDVEVMRSQGNSIAELQRNQREDKTELQASITHESDRLGNAIASLGDTQRRDRDTILLAIREDRADVHAALSGIQNALSTFKTEVIHELGTRPTRAEVNEVLFQTPRPRGKL